MRDQLIKALLAHAQGDIQKHVANVEVYLTNPASPLILLPPKLTVYQKFYMPTAPLKNQLVL